MDREAVEEARYAMKTMKTILNRGNMAKLGKHNEAKDFCPSLVHVLSIIWWKRCQNVDIAKAYYAVLRPFRSEIS
jgi:hypothetical protein